MIGNAEGVAHVVSSLGKSTGYVCVLAVAENYPIGKNFFRYFSHINLKEKLKLAAASTRSFYSVRKHGKGIFRKVPKVYFTSSSDIKLRSFEMLPTKIFEDIDLILVACEDNDSRTEYKSSDYVSELLRRGITREKIFIVPPVVYHAELPVIEDGKLSPLCKNMNEVKPLLRYMEYHVTDFCNLKCKGCGHLANHVKELEFADIGGFRLALAGLAEKFSNIAEIRIMGGEPLLCKNLHEYINAVHEIFPYCNVKIVTNGLLWRNITPEMIEAVKNAGAEIQVTQYIPTRKVAGEIIAFCQENGVKISVGTLIKEFRELIFAKDKPTPDFNECWSVCASWYCHLLIGTILHPCTYVWVSHDPRFKEFQGKESVTESEYGEYSYDFAQDISDDGWDILAKLENPMEICRKCGNKRVSFKWESEIPEYNN